jgi:dihydroorotate dehydrogenase electron transfer subunit
MPEGLPVPVTIGRIKQETPSVRTFFFDTPYSFVPGQFVMVWVPGTDEIPMALSSENSITVQNVGDATSALFKLQKGGMLGIRGPFGMVFQKQRRFLPLPEASGQPRSCPLYGPTAL